MAWTMRGFAIVLLLLLCGSALAQNGYNYDRPSQPFNADIQEPSNNQLSGRPSSSYPGTTPSGGSERNGNGANQFPGTSSDKFGRPQGGSKQNQNQFPSSGSDGPRGQFGGSRTNQIPAEGKQANDGYTYDRPRGSLPSLPGSSGRFPSSSYPGSVYSPGVSQGPQGAKKSDEKYPESTRNGANSPSGQRVSDLKDQRFPGSNQGTSSSYPESTNAQGSQGIPGRAGASPSGTDYPGQSRQNFKDQPAKSGYPGYPQGTQKPYQNFGGPGGAAPGYTGLDASSQNIPGASQKPLGASKDQYRPTGGFPNPSKTFGLPESAGQGFPGSAVSSQNLPGASQKPFGLIRDEYRPAAGFPGSGAGKQGAQQQYQPFGRLPGFGPDDLGSQAPSVSFPGAQKGTEGGNIGKFDDGSFEDGDFSAIPGEPGRDYPVLSEVPRTSFDCQQQEYPGYYADIETGCQALHVCANNKTYDFLCPNGTIFHQEYLVCVWWHQFDCNLAPQFYSINANIYDYSIIGSQHPGGQYPSSGTTGFRGAEQGDGTPLQDKSPYTPGKPFVPGGVSQGGERPKTDGTFSQQQPSRTGNAPFGGYPSSAQDTGRSSPQQSSKPESAYVGGYTSGRPTTTGDTGYAQEPLLPETFPFGRYSSNAHDSRRIPQQQSSPGSSAFGGYPSTAQDSGRSSQPPSKPGNTLFGNNPSERPTVLGGTGFPQGTSRPEASPFGGYPSNVEGSRRTSKPGIPAFGGYPSSAQDSEKSSQQSSGPGSAPFGNYPSKRPITADDFGFPKASSRPGASPFGGYPAQQQPRPGGSPFGGYPSSLQNSGKSPQQPSKPGSASFGGYPKERPTTAENTELPQGPSRPGASPTGGYPSNVQDSERTYQQQPRPGGSSLGGYPSSVQDSGKLPQQPSKPESASFGGYPKELPTTAENTGFPQGPSRPGASLIGGYPSKFQDPERTSQQQPRPGSPQFGGYPPSTQDSGKLPQQPSKPGSSPFKGYPKEGPKTPDNSRFPQGLSRPEVSTFERYPFSGQDSGRTSQQPGPGSGTYEYYPSTAQDSGKSTQQPQRPGSVPFGGYPSTAQDSGRYPQPPGTTPFGSYSTQRPSTADESGISQGPSRPDKTSTGSYPSSALDSGRYPQQPSRPGTPYGVPIPSTARESSSEGSGRFPQTSTSQQGPSGKPQEFNPPQFGFTQQSRGYLPPYNKS